jgi:hypothetical protein
MLARDFWPSRSSTNASPGPGSLVPQASEARCAAGTAHPHGDRLRRLRPPEQRVRDRASVRAYAARLSRLTGRAHHASTDRRPANFHVLS